MIQNTALPFARKMARRLKGNAIEGDFRSEPAPAIPSTRDAAIFLLRDKAGRKFKVVVERFEDPSC